MDSANPDHDYRATDNSVRLDNWVRWPNVFSLNLLPRPPAMQCVCVCVCACVRVRACVPLCVVARTHACFAGRDEVECLSQNRMFVPRATSSCADARAHLQVGALDGLSPGLSAASSADSLRSLLRGRRGRSTTDDEGSKASRESSSENLSVHSASCRSDPGGLSSSVTSRASRTRHGGFNSTSQITRVQFQVTVETHFGDHVRVVGSCPELGCWQPDKSQLLTTDPSMYPTWTGSLEMSSSEPFEYKYIIQRAPAVSSSPSPAASFEWEGKIGNRAAIPEGVFVVLEDGHFNMERATVFDRSHRKVDLTGQGSSSGFLDHSSTGFLDHAAGGRDGLAGEQASKQSLFIISFKLPLKTSRLASGGYRFEWHPGKHRTTSARHAGYVVEKLRKLRKRVQVTRLSVRSVRRSQRESVMSYVQDSH